MTEWISVKDRLPEHDTLCVVMNEKRVFQHYISLYSKYFQEFEVSLIGMSRLYDPITFNATHWFPIPELPREKE